MSTWSPDLLTTSSTTARAAIKTNVLIVGADQGIGLEISKKFDTENPSHYILMGCMSCSNGRKLRRLPAIEPIELDISSDSSLMCANVWNWKHDPRIKSCTCFWDLLSEVSYPESAMLNSKCAFIILALALWALVDWQWHGMMERHRHIELDSRRLYTSMQRHSFSYLGLPLYPFFQVETQSSTQGQTFPHMIR